VFAGTLNQHGTLVVETQRVGTDTAFGKIIQAVEKAEKTRAPIQRTADRLAGYLVRENAELPCRLLFFNLSCP
jgi:cation transport ATPase